MPPRPCRRARCTTPLGVLLAAAARWFNPLAMASDVLVGYGQMGSVASSGLVRMAG